LSAKYFWHPVGSHAGESLEEIVLRKTADIEQHGFTLWSFTPARSERVEAWRADIATTPQTQVLCCGEATQDPGEGRPVHWAREVSSDKKIWTAVPPRMTSYHRPPNKQGIMASAFQVIQIEAQKDLFVERPKWWLKTDRPEWVNRPVPTRGEYLVKNVAFSSGRTVRLLLTLSSPFVVWVR